MSTYIYIYVYTSVYMYTDTRWGFSDGSVIKNLPANTGDSGLLPGLGRSPGRGNGNPFSIPA